ncbi:MAG TPA: response regulator transcription factor [Anaerolineales bacterium]|nr:response regulator transcription factor [Anaerolineales bacterium]
MAETILVVEDEPSLQETLVYNLEKQGYKVEAAGDGRAALESARRLVPDLIVLDIMLPELDGFEVCKILRKEMTVPILMLTARDDEIDRVVGLEVGADDYLTKPFSMRELLARVKAQLRRTGMLREEMARIKAPEANTPQEVLAFDNLELNLTRREVTLGGQVLALKPQEYDLLLFFAQHKGQMLSREFILERVWGWDYIGDSRTVDVHVRWLRQKIEKDAASPARIVTVRGGGYRFEG